MIKRYEIPLLPFIEKREEHEKIRASRARNPKKQKVKKIPIRFVSVNNMYPVSPFGRGKYLSDEGRLWKEYIKEMLEEQDNGVPFVFGEDFYEISYIFYMTHEMLYTKDDNLRKIDVSNMLKAAEDALFDYLLDDDSSVVSIHGHKRLTLEDPKAVFLVSPADITDGILHKEKTIDTYKLEHNEALL